MLSKSYCEASDGSCTLRKQMPVNATGRPFRRVYSFTQAPYNYIDMAFIMASCVSQLVDTLHVNVISDEKCT